MNCLPCDTIPEKWRKDYTIEIDESVLDKAELKRVGH